MESNAVTLVSHFFPVPLLLLGHTSLFSDAGKYSCVISTAHGAKEDTSDLKVRCKPEITQSLKDLEAKSGEKDVSFVLQANAYPEPKIKWFVDEIEITEERKEFSRDDDPANGTYSLILKEVKSELSGKYTAQVTNALGQAKSSALLSVQCNFIFQIQDTSTLVICMSNLFQMRPKWRRR